jgi:hypothetical protein
MNMLSTVTSISDGKQLAEVVGMLRTMRLDVPVRHEADESAAKRAALLLPRMNDEANASSMLALVRRMRKEVTFSLAVKAGKPLRKPHIPLLQEDNVRVRFLEEEDGSKVLPLLPRDLAHVVEFA